LIVLRLARGQDPDYAQGQSARESDHLGQHIPSELGTISKRGDKPRAANVIRWSHLI